MISSADRSFLLVIDLQPAFMVTMPDADAIIHRAAFLCRVAGLMGVPVVVTEQYPSRMGGTDPRILEALSGATYQIHPKMTFSAWADARTQSAIRALGRDQAVVVGCETHICVTQSVLHMIEADLGVFVAEDAVTGRGSEVRASAFRRMAAAGASLSHTESVTYEWMGSAEHPAFRDVLRLVKEG